MNFEKNIKTIKNQSKQAQLVVVTKNQSLQNINNIYKIGERNFGENKVQDLLKKQQELPNDINWHMIGHLQTNKVKLITPFIHMIQSVDSLKLIKKINSCGEQDERIINCLIQIKIAEEDTKYGFSIKEAKEILTTDILSKYRYISVQGIMGMASFSTNTNQIKNEFKLMKQLFDACKNKYPILSMGMSNDYIIAYQAGSNMLRVGSAIFQKTY
ncbi:MAG: YggS family pyridoxal phosphate-dependent enzyme [Flavobacteriales bacterium]|nr:YggS family pyridoxal phosphate-dependent enzyme [Flavobacteriales bacterium]